MNSSTKSSLVSLPDHIVEEIIEYISFEDKLNLRLSCRYFYNVCNSKLLFEKAQIKLKTLKRNNIFSFEQLMGKFWSFGQVEFRTVRKWQNKINCTTFGVCTRYEY